MIRLLFLFGSFLLFTKSLVVDHKLSDSIDCIEILGETSGRFNGKRIIGRNNITRYLDNSSINKICIKSKKTDHELAKTITEILSNQKSLYDLTVWVSEASEQFELMLESLKGTFVDSLTIIFEIRNGSKGIDKALSNLDLKSLKIVSENRLDDNFIFDLSKGLKGSQLTRLSLHGSMSHKGVQNIADHLPDLTSLSIRGSNIDDEAARIISKRLRDSSIASFTLSGSFGDLGLSAITDQLPNSRVTSLKLIGDFGDQGLSALSSSRPSNLTILRLASSSIGSDDGMESLANYLRGSRVSTLSLAGCKIGDDSILILADVLGEIPLHDLSINDFRGLSLQSSPGCGKLGDWSAFAITKAMRFSQLATLNIASTDFSKNALWRLSRAIEESQLIQVSITDGNSHLILARKDSNLSKGKHHTLLISEF